LTKNLASTAVNSIHLNCGPSGKPRVPITR
jgi:hypothetical protein